MKHSKRVAAVAVIIGGVGVLSMAALRADPIPPGWQTSNMEPIGYSDLEGRGGALKLTIKQVNGRWYLYMGHLWNYGFSIVDVTDPKAPRYVRFVEMPSNNWDIQLTHHDNILIAAMERQAPSWGGDPAKPFHEGIILWDISDPENRQQYLGMEDRRHRHPSQLLSRRQVRVPVRGRARLSRRRQHPRHSRHQRSRDSEGGGRRRAAGREGRRGADRRPARLPRPGQSQPRRQAARHGLFARHREPLDISDVAHPKMIGELRMSPPFLSAGSQSLHTALPLWDRNLVYANSEASAERCTEALNFAALIDNNIRPTRACCRCFRCRPRRRARRTRTSAKKAAGSVRTTPTRKFTCLMWRSPAT